MSNILAIAAVTAIIKSLLENSLIQQAVTTGIGDVVVTALPPDRIALGADERPQLNLYLYRLTPNSGWRRAGPPDSEMPRQEQFLALDLHYLLSAYGEHDYQAEVLLGAAIQCLQDSSNFSGNNIRAALGSLATSKSSSVTVKALARAVQSIHLEQIRLTSEWKFSTTNSAKEDMVATRQSVGQEPYTTA